MVGRIKEVAALTGFSYEKMYGCFARGWGVGDGGWGILAVTTRWLY